MRRVLLLTACVVGSCDGEEALPDAMPPAMTYRLAVTPAEPMDRPARSVRPTIFIDGVERSRLEVEYPSAEASYGAQHVLEMRFDGVTVVSKTLTIDDDFCLMRYPNVVGWSEGYCMYESGDFRLGGYQATTLMMGVCIGDFFCAPACGCGVEERCTSRIASTVPLVSHLGCAPIGPRAVGETCSLIADPAGAYDDCGAGLLCVAGTCQQLCDQPFISCAQCEYVEGHAPELRVCVP